MESDRVPPNNKLAERTTLGSMMRDNRVIDELLPMLHSDDFYTDAHRKIHVVILDLHSRRVPVDAVTVAEQLHNRSWVKDVGGYGYLADLWDAAPTGANARYYAGIVREKSKLRQLINLTAEIGRDAQECRGTADDLIDEASSQLLAISDAGRADQAVTLNEAIVRAFDEIDQRSNGQGMIATGFEQLDRLAGGLQSRQLTIIAARPSVGKTTFALALLRNHLFSSDIPQPSLFVSLEQMAGEAAERLLAQEGRINTHSLRRPRNLTPRDHEALASARSALWDRPLFILEQRRRNATQIAALSRSYRHRHNIGLVVIDYLQLIRADNRRLPRHEQVGETVKILRELAGELNVPVVVLAQLNREGEKMPGGKPRLSHLRESGDCEQDADCVWLIHNPLENGEEQSGPVRTCLIQVAKNRNGQTGEMVLRHHRAEMRFESIEESNPFGGRS